MTSSALEIISSRDNSFIKTCKKIAQTGSHYRKEGLAWIEGDHLVAALLHSTYANQIRYVLVADTYLHKYHALLQHPNADNSKMRVLDESLFTYISALPSHTGIAALFQVPNLDAHILPDTPTVILDGVQDAGNVGSILRSCAAFGFKQVLTLSGTASVWSPKVTRSAMGAHFSLHLIESVADDAISQLQMPILCTNPHAGDFIHATSVQMPCAWIFGHEGQGVRPTLMERASMQICIRQPKGQESLNVAAAAAICLHASSAAL